MTLLSTTEDFLQRKTFSKVIWVFANAPSVSEESMVQVRERIQNNDIVVGVDGGAEICRRYGVYPDLIVGDQDSISPETLYYFREVKILEFPPEKDQSDLELALQFLSDQYFSSDNDSKNDSEFPSMIYVINGLGGRTDHFLFNCLLALKYPTITRFFDQNGIIFALVPNTKYILYFHPKSIFSLIPFSQCQGVKITGAKYPLDNAELFSSTLSLSNESIDEPVQISFTSGRVLLYAENLISHTQT